MLVHVGQILVIFTLYSQVEHFTGTGGHVEAMPTNTAVRPLPIEQYGYWDWEGDSARMANYQNYQQQQHQQPQQQQQQHHPMNYGNQNIYHNPSDSRIPSNQNANTNEGHSGDNLPYTIPPGSYGGASGFLVTPRPSFRLQQFNANRNNCAPGVAC